LLSTRALGARCGTTGIDVAGYVDAFAADHAREYERASQTLSAHGLNAEIVWSLFTEQIEGLSKRHLDQYAAHAGAADDHGVACRNLASRPRQFAEARNFKANYPALYSRLMME
jgi:hypothetical protein